MYARIQYLEISSPYPSTPHRSLPWPLKARIQNSEKTDFSVAMTVLCWKRWAPKTYKRAQHSNKHYQREDDVLTMAISLEKEKPRAARRRIFSLQKQSGNNTISSRVVQICTKRQWTSSSERRCRHKDGESHRRTTTHKLTNQFSSQRRWTSWMYNCARRSGLLSIINTISSRWWQDSTCRPMDDKFVIVIN